MKTLRISLGISYVLGYPLFAFFAPSLAADAGPLLGTLFVSGPIIFVIGHIQLSRRPTAGRVIMSIGAGLAQIWTASAIFFLPPLALGSVAMVVAAVAAWRPVLDPASPLPNLDEI